MDATFSGDYQPVLTASIFDGWLTVGGDFTQQNPLSFLEAGTWFYYDYGQFYAYGDGRSHGFLEHNDRLITYGGFEFMPIIGTYSRGIDELFHTGNDGEQIAFWTDGTVTAAASFQGEAYFAGDFQTVNNQPFNGLFRSPLDGATPTTSYEEEKVKVYQANEQLFLTMAEPSSAETVIHLYDLQGQIAFQQTLSEGISEMQWPIGSIIYRLFI